MRTRRRERGSAIIEFVLTGIPMIFVCISIVQMSIGMWHYHTLQYAVKATAAYIAHHGSGCDSPNTCSIQIRDAANVLKTTAIGIPANELNVTFGSFKRDAIGNIIASTPVNCRLDNCLTNATPWPPSGFKDPGSDIDIKADYIFKSALSMYAPGPGSQTVSFGQFHLPGYAYQQVLF